MAIKVTASVLGGQTKTFEEVDSISELKQLLQITGGSYTAAINGDTVSDDEELDDYCFVSFAPAVKGAL